MRPDYELGDEVRVVRNVRDDGTFPGMARGELLIRRGSTGYVKDIGTFLQDQLIYTVHFIDSDQIVGCRQEELQLAAARWVPSLFESREWVAAALPLGMQGEVFVTTGTIGEVLKVVRGDETVSYQVNFPGRVLQVPETALQAAGVSAG